MDWLEYNGRARFTVGAAKNKQLRVRVTVVWQHAQNYEVIVLESTAPV